MNLTTMTLNELVAEYKRHNRLYWIENKPEISDHEFDALENKIRQLDPNNSVLDQLHGELNDPVTHSVPMLSMEKAYSFDAMTNWAKKSGDNLFMVSCKMDGSACSLKYVKGKLVQAATRGNGAVGEDITQNVLRIKNVPKSLKNVPDVMYVRGEVVMPNSVFKKKFASTNSNTRNLAAGSLKHKDPNESENRELKFWAYNVIGTDWNTEQEKFDNLEKLSFDVVPHILIKVEDFEKSYNQIVGNRSNCDFDIDGVIFCANDVDIQKKLGLTSHHPKYAIAWKIQGESGTTKLLDIEWSISRTGVVTPVAIVEPVQLSGVTVGRSSIHHAGFVLSKKLSKNAIIEMTRRGGVIPHIERVVKDGDALFTIPKVIDGYEVEMIDDFLYLKHPEQHPDVQVARLVHFCAALEMDGFGDKIVKQLYDNGVVKDLDDIFRLTKQSVMNGLDRSGDRMAEKLVDEMNSKKRIPLDRFLYSLGIDCLGNSVSKLLAKKYTTLKNVYVAPASELVNLDGIGETIAEAVVSGIHKNRVLIMKLKDLVEVLDYVEVKIVGGLSTTSFVFTGTLETMDRKEAQKLAESKGANCPSSVSKDLTYLVVGGNDTESSKYKKANDLIKKGAKIQIITESEFVNIVSK